MFGGLESRKSDQRWDKIWLLRAKSVVTFGAVRVVSGSRGESWTEARVWFEHATKGFAFRKEPLHAISSHNR